MVLIHLTGPVLIGDIRQQGPDIINMLMSIHVFVICILM
jgi:hypothetical protein